MNQLIEEITKLTEEWYTVISPDHHKDRDCHWFIETKWSYGDLPKYSVQHRGYIVREIDENWNTYELALKRLKGLLTREIEVYKNDRSHENEW
jgi:hypothetical protein